jgi:soluble lytic murein transglycosylase-like protein
MKSRNRMLCADVRAHPEIDTARFWPHPQPLIETGRSALELKALRSGILRGTFVNSRWLTLGFAAALAVITFVDDAQAGKSDYDAMVERHALANHVPAALVHRVIMRESKYHPELIGRGGTVGLMQIKLATARALGYSGDAEGLRDPDTNLAYGVKYLAGAYRVADGDHDRAMHYYAAGYYEAAKRLRHAERRRLVANGNPQSALGDDAPRKRAKDRVKDTVTARARVPSAPLSIVPAGAKAMQPR